MSKIKQKTEFMGVPRLDITTAIIFPMDLSNTQIERYSRQIVLPEIGMEGQKKILSAKVLVLGAGGLGSAVLYNLASSGVGNIGVVDFDKVDLSNLHRQNIHFSSDVGKTKVLSVKEKISQINPDVKVTTFNEKLTEENVETIFKEFDVVVDCLDTFKDKFLVNDSCLKLNKKLIHAGVVGYEGQLLTIIPGASISLRDLFPDGEPSDLRGTCKEIGVLPTCVSIISSLQANEVLKIVLGIGKLYTNKVLKFNAMSGKFHEFEICKQAV